MSEIKDLKKSLPITEHSFSINIQGNASGKMFEGNFTCKIPNMKTQAMIEKHKAMLNAGLEAHLDLGTKNLHHMISTLRHVLTDAPKWWKDADFGYELFDINVVQEVYDKTLAFEKEWLESIWGPEEGSDGPEKRG